MSVEKKRILCVDDQEDISVMLAITWQPLGYEIINVTTISAAVSLINSQDFNLYIIDNRLPDGRGLDLCHHIRTSDAQTPIIFYSGEARAEDQQAAFAAGVQAFVVKPDLANKLEETMRQLLAH